MVKIFRILSLLVLLLGVTGVQRSFAEDDTAALKSSYGSAYTDTVWLPWGEASHEELLEFGGKVCTVYFTLRDYDSGSGIGCVMWSASSNAANTVLLNQSVITDMAKYLIAVTASVELGTNVISCSAVDHATNSAPFQNDGGLSTDFKVKYIQLTNTGTVTTPTGYSFSETTTSLQLTLPSVPVGASASLDCTPSMGGPNETYTWTGAPDGAEISGGSCKFTSLTPGAYTVTCVYSWDTFASGTTDWEGTIAATPGRQSISVTFHVTVIKLSVVIDYIIGPNDSDYSDDAPQVSGSFTTDPEENGIECYAHVEPTEWAAYESQIQWGYQVESGLLSETNWSTLMSGGFTETPVSGFSAATNGRTRPLSAQFQAWIPLTDTLYVANPTGFVGITQDAKDRERQRYMDMGVTDRMPARDDLITRSEYEYIIGKESMLFPGIPYSGDNGVACKGGTNDCNGDGCSARSPNCRLAEHDALVPYAVIDVVIAYNRLVAAYGSAITVTSVYRCPMHTKCQSPKGLIASDHTQGLAFDYSGSVSEILAIAEKAYEINPGWKILLYDENDGEVKYRDVMGTDAIANTAWRTHAHITVQ